MSSSNNNANSGNTSTALGGNSNSGSMQGTSHSDSQREMSKEGTSASMSSINTDTSLLHQLARLQTEKQEWLNKTREYDNRLKERDDTLVKMKENYEKEHAEFIETSKREMQEQFRNFMEDWMVTMKKESPEVVEQVMEGAKNAMQEGRKNDKVWNLLCCASKVYKNNVNAIEELRKTNELLATQNQTLEEHLKTSSGFNNADTRLTKRARVDDPQSMAPQRDGANAVPSSRGESDVWGQFESFMTSSTNRAMY
jgi:hypothetical protein